MNNNIQWSAMQIDCLAEIFTRLGLDDLTVTVPFVCRSWLAAARHPLCWKKLDFRRVDILPWSHFSKTFIFLHSIPFFTFTYFLKLAVRNSIYSVTDLSLPLKFTSSEDLEFICNKCPKLKSFALPILSSDEEILVLELVQKCKDLERLELKFSPANLPGLLKNISLYCNKFSELIFSGEIREEIALAIVNYLPGIKKLNLGGSFLSKKELLFIVKGCKKLQELNVNDCVGFEGNDEEIRAEVSAIRDFDCERCKLYLEDAYDCVDLNRDFCFYGYIF